MTTEQILNYFFWLKERGLTLAPSMSKKEAPPRLIVQKKGRSDARTLVIIQYEMAQGLAEDERQLLVNILKSLPGDLRRDFQSIGFYFQGKLALNLEEAKELVTSENKGQLLLFGEELLPLFQALTVTEAELYGCHPLRDLSGQALLLPSLKNIKAFPKLKRIVWERLKAFSLIT